MQDVIRKIEMCWSRETAMSPETWTPENPCKDQCAVTAALVYELADIPVVRGIAHLPDGSTDSHYWTEGLDLTKGQYPEGTRIEVREGPQGADASAYLLTNPDLVRRLDVLRDAYVELTDRENDASAELDL